MTERVFGYQILLELIVAKSFSLSRVLLFFTRFLMKESTRASHDEEDATELQLGEDFQNAQCLMNSEVLILLDHIKHRRNDMAATGSSTMTSGDVQFSTVFQKTLSYTKRFSRFSNKETVREVRQLLSNSKGFEQFEVAQLGNLCPETSEEAKALIPSLTYKKSDEDMQDVLVDLANFRKFQS